MNWKDLLFKKNLLFHAISILLFAVITLVYCSPILEGEKNRTRGHYPISRNV